MAIAFSGSLVEPHRQLVADDRPASPFARDNTARSDRTSGRSRTARRGERPVRGDDARQDRRGRVRSASSSWPVSTSCAPSERGQRHRQDAAVRCAAAQPPPARDAAGERRPTQAGLDPRPVVEQRLRAAAARRRSGPRSARTRTARERDAARQRRPAAASGARALRSERSSNCQPMTSASAGKIGRM